jgi:hypothetical protein
MLLLLLLLLSRRRRRRVAHLGRGRVLERHCCCITKVVRSTVACFSFSSFPATSLFFGNLTRGMIVILGAVFTISAVHQLSN